jgi:hypothetical protein
MAETPTKRQAHRPLRGGEEARRAQVDNLRRDAAAEVGALRDIRHEGVLLAPSPPLSNATSGLRR